MNEKKWRLGFPLTPIILVALGVLVIYLTVDVGRQAITSHRRDEEQSAVEAKVEAAKARNAALQEMLKLAQSDAAAEEWARSQGWARPNEVPVVIVAPEATAPIGSQAAPRPSGSSSTNPQAWWNLFFGDR